MPDSVELRCGAGRLFIHLDRVQEWLLPQWRGAMRLMKRGGWLNTEAVHILSEWFPDAIKTAGEELREAEKCYKTSWRSLKDTPKDQREHQKNLNRIVYEGVQSARSKEDKLKKRYLEFLAEKANMEKEN